MWAGYGTAWAFLGSVVLVVVWVFQAEFPGVLQASSTPVALLVLTQTFLAGAALMERAEDPTMRRAATITFLNIWK